MQNVFCPTTDQDLFSSHNKLLSIFCPNLGVQVTLVFSYDFFFELAKVIILSFQRQ